MHPKPVRPMRKARAVALRSMMEWSRGRLRTRPTNASGEIIDEMELHAGTIASIVAARMARWTRSPRCN